MSTGGGKRAIVAALLANLGIAVSKFVAFLITGSSSLLAESVHSVADTGNQGLLLLGASGRRVNLTPSTRSATAATGTSTPSSSPWCCSASGRCSRCSRATRRSATRIRWTRRPLPSACWWSPSAWSPSRSGPRSGSPPRYGARCRGGASSAAPSPRSCRWCCSRTAAALLGLVFALLGVGLAVALDEPRFDGVGTLAIGLLLGVVAAILAVEMKSLLTGESASADQVEAIRTALVDGRDITRDPHAHPAPGAGGAVGCGEDRPSAGAGPARRRGRHRRRRAAGAGGGADRPLHLPRARPLTVRRSVRTPPARARSAPEARIRRPQRPRRPTTTWCGCGRCRSTAVVEVSSPRGEARRRSPGALRT